MLFSWVSIPGADRERVLEVLGLVETGEFDLRDEYEMRCNEAGGSLTIFAVNASSLSREAMASLSILGPTIGLRANHEVLTSAAWAWSEKVEQWAITYRPGEGLKTQGSLPSTWVDVLARETAYGGEPNWDLPTTFAAEVNRTAEGEDARRGTVPRVLERLRPGKDGVKQLERQSAARRLETRVVGEIYPMLEKLGFERAANRDDYDQLYGRGAPNVFIRLAQERASGVVEVLWSTDRAGPRLVLLARKDVRNEPAANAPLAMAERRTEPGASLKRLFGGKLDPAAAIDQTITDGLVLVSALDAWLERGELHPWIKEHTR